MAATDAPGAVQGFACQYPALFFFIVSEIWVFCSTAVATCYVCNILRAYVPAAYACHAPVGMRVCELLF